MNDISEKVEEAQLQSGYAGLPETIVVKHDTSLLDPLAIESEQKVGCDALEELKKEELLVPGAGDNVKDESNDEVPTQDNGVMNEDEIDEDKLLEDPETTNSVDEQTSSEPRVHVTTPPTPDFLELNPEPVPSVDNDKPNPSEENQNIGEDNISVIEETIKEEKTIETLEESSTQSLNKDIEEEEKEIPNSTQVESLEESTVVDEVEEPELEIKEVKSIEDKIAIVPEKPPDITITYHQSVNVPEKLVTAPENTTIVSEINTTIIEKNIIVPEKAELTPENPLSLLENTVRLPEKPVTVVKKAIALPEKPIPPVPEKAIAEKAVTLPEKVIAQVEKAAPVPDKPVAVLEKVVTRLDKTIFVPHKTAIETEKSVSALEKIIAEVGSKKNKLVQKSLIQREEKNTSVFKEKHQVELTEKVKEIKQEKLVDIEMKAAGPVLEMEPQEKPRPKSVQPVNGDVSKEEPPIKRRASEDLESENPLKRLCQEVEKTFPQHDTMVNDYIQTATKNNIDELQRHTEQLLSEIQTLRELAQKKEHEWNNILHLKKVKEEILLRLLRRKQVLSFEKSSDMNGPEPGRLDPFDYMNQPKNLAIDKSDDISGLSLKQPSSMMNPMMQGPMMPVTSHYNAMTGLPPPYDKGGHMQIPKPPMFPQQLMMPGPGMSGFPRDMNGQMQVNYMPMGRQGPTKDVKSIIADYRQRNPDMVPRRGRRMKSILNPNMMNPRPIAPKVDHMNSLNNLNMLFNNLDMNQKAMLERLQQIQGGGLPNGVSFKDVLVQFANMQQNPAMMPNRPPEPMNRPEHQIRPERRRPERNHEEAPSSSRQTERLASPSPRLPPPPPYPEISLLPVNTPQDTNQTSQNSLLHGILTKQAATTSQSYSPTLAKLLTSPERKQSTPTLPTFGQAKNCGEITITPVQPLVPPPPEPQTQPEKPEEVVQLDDEESAASEGDAVASPSGSGKLVIDEALGEETPLCQGCRRKDAQFVCAGCANQWYCSRDCQVAAWDDHSDMCSG